MKVVAVLFFCGVDLIIDLLIRKKYAERQTEQTALRGAMDRFSIAFELAPHMKTIMRKCDCRYVDVNRHFLEARGFAREDVIGKTPTEMGMPQLEFEQIIEILETQGSIQNYEGTIIMKDGSLGTVIISAETIQIDDQECIILGYNDITEMKSLQMEKLQMERTEQLNKTSRLEKDLSRSNQLILHIIDNMQDGFFVLDDQWRFTYVNKIVEKIFLKKREEILNQVFCDVNPKASTNVFKIYQKVQQEGRPITFEIRGNIRQDRWYQVTASPSQFGLSVYYRDITDVKLASDKLMEAQLEKVSILESMTDCFFALDENWQFTYINRAGEIAFGNAHDEWLGKTFTEVFKVNVTALQHYYQVMHEKKSVTFEIISEALDNKWIEISAYPTETGMTCYFHDITSRKIAEKEFARLDRLNLVAQLAAGIAHEIRNPMTTVRGYLEFLGWRPEYIARKPTFDLMITELDRANAIITEFLSLAQTKQTELKYQDLNVIISNLFPLIQADSVNQNKQLSFIEGEIPSLELNANEITQLVLNLTRNGLQAMREKGCLNINSYVEEGQVVLAMADEGCGIPPENLARLGTPFFTTKDTGTGLGLAICYKIAESHKAKIQIDSSAKCVRRCCVI